MLLRSSILFAILMVSWLLLSGHFSPALIALGALSVTFAVAMAIQIDATDSEGLPLHLMGGLPLYLVWLSGQILLSDWATMRVILLGGESPKLFHIKTGHMSGAALVLYANSITLTPGTVTVDVTEDGLLVHALTGEMAAEVKNDHMGDWIRKLDRVVE